MSVHFPLPKTVELIADNPDIPSHFIVGHRYYANQNGRVVCDAHDAETLMGEGCRYAPGHEPLPQAPAPLPDPLAYQPITSMVASAYEPPATSYVLTGTEE